MSATNVELVQAGYAALNQGGLEALLDGWDPAVVVHDVSRPDPTSADGDWHGHEGVRRYVGDWLDSFEESRSEPTEFRTAGEHVLVEVHAEARGRGSGIEIANDRYHMFTIRDGLVVQFGVYADEADALAAAGLAESH
jgi:ketosteroid isomerase-like protein